MAEKKISQLTAKGATIADTDLIVISESAGGGTYVSKSATGANVKALVTDANLTTTDITTNDVSITKHGFVPKAPNDATKFLDGTGIWSTPSGGGLTYFTEAENTSAPNGTVYVDSLTAAASSTNADVAIVPKGSGAFMLDIPDGTATGGNKRGTNAIDLQQSRTSATQVASGANSFVVGTGSTASGGQASAAIGDRNTSSGVASFSAGSLSTASNQASLSIGQQSTASGLQSVALGYQSVASGNYAVCFSGESTASGVFSFVQGYKSVANSNESVVFGTGCTSNLVVGRQVRGYARNRGFSGTGETQKSEFFLSVRTTDATATTVTVAGGAASTTNQVILSNNSAYGFTGTIIGKQSGSTNAVMWKVEGLIARGANAASTVLTTSTVTLVSNAPAWGTPTLAADTTNGGLQVQVVGAAATNIQWTAVIETTEVIYA